MKIRMVQEKVKKFIVSPEECIHCNDRKKDYIKQNKKINSGRNLMCRKHAAIYDWSWGKTSQNTGLLNHQGKLFCFFSEYVLMEMNTDSDGLFVLWFSKLERDKNAIFCIHKKYFQEVFTKGVNMDSVLLYKYLLYNNNWLLDMTHAPVLERIDHN